MAGLMIQLIGVLEEHAGLCETLVSLGTQKKDCIIKNDVDALRKITVQENTAVGRIQRVERMRVELVNDIAGVLNENAAELTLSRLAEIIKEQAEHPDFVQASARLKTAIEALQNLNEHNKLLLQNALEYIDFNINLIKSTYSGDQTGYMPDGNEAPGSRSFLDVKN